MARQISRSSSTSERTEGASSAAVRSLEGEGFSLPTKPKHDVPQLPLDICELTDTDLMEMFVAFSAWAGFYGVRVAQAEVDEQEAENFLRIEEAKATVRNWSGLSDARVTIAKANRDMDAKVVDQRDELLKLKAFRKVLATLHENVTRDMNLVSRELTRRTSYNPSERASTRRTR